MRKFGCLLIGLICFVSIVGVYAFNIIEKDDVHTPDYYESNVRSMFGREQWEAGKQLLDEGLSIYPDVNGLNELCGRYHYRKKDYDTARYFLVRAVRDNPENVEAKQIRLIIKDFGFERTRLCLRSGRTDFVLLSVCTCFRARPSSSYDGHEAGHTMVLQYPKNKEYGSNGR